MEMIFRIALFISGIINVSPAILAFLPGKISKSYGLDTLNTDLELLLRHRAVMLGIVGGLLIYSAFSKEYYSISVIVGLISMVSFIILYFLLKGINQELGKVMKFDLVALLILLVGALLYAFKN